MKNILFLTLFVFFATFSVNAETNLEQNSTVDFYTQKQFELEIKRLNQEIAELKLHREQYLALVRDLEKSNKNMQTKLEGFKKQINSLIDLWVNFENVSLPNLAKADETLANRINETNKKFTDDSSSWNWGLLTRDCKNIGKHQQIRTVLSKDKSASIKYLCFDGKVIHLGTESNLAPIVE